MDLLTVTNDLPAFGQNLQTADLNAVVIGIVLFSFLCHLMLAGQTLIPEQMAFYARNQFHRVKRLYNIVVRSQTEPPDLVHRFRLCRHHENRNVNLLPDLTADIISALFRHHDVKNQKVKLLLIAPLHCLFSVRCDHHLMPAHLQIIPLQICDFPVIFRQQNACHHRFLPASSAICLLTPCQLPAWPFLFTPCPLPAWLFFSRPALFRHGLFFSLPALFRHGLFLLVLRRLRQTHLHMKSVFRVGTDLSAVLL